MNNNHCEFKQDGKWVFHDFLQNIVIDNYFINIYVGGTFFRKRRIIHVLCLRQQRKITNSRSAKTLGTELLGRYPGNSVFTQNN